MVASAFLGFLPGAIKGTAALKAIGLSAVAAFSAAHHVPDGDAGDAHDLTEHSEDHGDHSHHGGGHHDEQEEHDHEEHEHGEDHDEKDHGEVSDGEEGAEFDPDETEELAEMELTTAPGMADQPGGRRGGSGAGGAVGAGERMSKRPGSKVAPDKIAAAPNDHAHILLVVAAASAAASATSRLVEGRCRDLGVTPFRTTTVKRRYLHRCEAERLRQAL